MALYGNPASSAGPEHSPQPGFNAARHKRSADVRLDQAVQSRRNTTSAVDLVVDEHVRDASRDELQDRTRNWTVAGEHIVHHRAVTERPALHGVRGSESICDLHKSQLSCGCGPWHG
jgi:hypothetical protein